MMQNIAFPCMLEARQKYPASIPLDNRATLQQAFDSAGVLRGLKPGARIAVAVGSRGITSLASIVTSVLGILKGAGARPFIVPAMGSHGGATPDGQCELLAGYGITEKLGVPIESAMEVEKLGTTDDGVDLFFSTAALRADGIIVVNRVKPHTDFGGASGSGIMKMIVVGLGKRAGAVNFHAVASRLGYEHALLSMARLAINRAPILGGVAILENQRHETARLAVLKPGTIEEDEKALLEEAWRLMPKLPSLDIDLLIVDRLGKNVSGTGMDPNVIGRSIQGYSSSLHRDDDSPFIRRIFVRDLTPETHGNAIGIGLADFTTTRLVKAINLATSYVNSLTALTIQSCKIPIHFDTDYEAIVQALTTLAMPDTRRARVVRIKDTLSLEKLEISEAYAQQMDHTGILEVSGSASEMRFDQNNNLLPLPDQVR
ncbi:MAG: nickel-dependent lactate racemase [Candidatus Omnitrophica bacterium]|nr:nickel-dependent lactate racemase [Candidatus Omnitrophota bacterium]